MAISVDDTQNSLTQSGTWSGSVCDGSGGGDFIFGFVNVIADRSWGHGTSYEINNGSRKRQRRVLSAVVGGTGWEKNQWSSVNNVSPPPSFWQPTRQFSSDCILACDDGQNYFFVQFMYKHYRIPHTLFSFFKFKFDLRLNVLIQKPFWGSKRS